MGGYASPTLHWAKTFGSFFDGVLKHTAPLGEGELRCIATQLNDVEFQLRFNSGNFQ
jgi:hypothetical protein